MKHATKTRVAVERTRRMAYLRGKLLEKRRVLLENVQAQINSTQEPAGLPGDAGDMASSCLATEETYRIGAIGSDAVAQIDYAIQRLDSGKYGICEDCGKPIPEVRLRAVPFAYLCVDCKGHEERENRESLEPGAELVEFDDSDAGHEGDEVHGASIVRGRRPSE